MAEAGIHAIAIDPGVRGKPLVFGLQERIQIELFRIGVVGIERVAGVHQLSANTVGAAKRAGAVHALDRFRRQWLAADDML